MPTPEQVSSALTEQLKNILKGKLPEGVDGLNFGDIISPDYYAVSAALHKVQAKPVPSKELAQTFTHFRSSKDDVLNGRKADDIAIERKESVVKNKKGMEFKLHQLVV